MAVSRTLSPQKTVLFVCTGNVCRSPMAEGLFRKMIAGRPDLKVSSAGVSTYPGQSPSPHAVEVLAHSGIFETKADRLMLQRSIQINSATYQAHLSEAVVNIKLGHVVSEKPVEITMLKGTLNANRFEIINSGEIVRFEQGVTMVLTMDAAPPGRAAGSQ